MKFIFVIFIFFAFIAAPQFCVGADEAWTSVKSKNFHIVGSADEAELRRVAIKLEQFRYVFTQLFGELNFVSPIPTTVIVFKDEASFVRFKPVNEDGSRRDWVVGYFQPGKDVNYIALPASGEKTNSLSTIYHEYVHFLIDNTLGRTNIPPWFNEGFAEYYEQTIIGDDEKATLGAVNTSHLSILRKNGLIPFEKFFTVDYYALNRQTKENVVHYYAQAWALMHFLIQGNKGARNQDLRYFTNLLLKGKSSKDAFEEAFKTDYAALEAEIKKYIERKTFDVSAVNLDKNLVAGNEMQISPLSAAEAKAYQGDLLFHQNRLNEANALLRESLTLNPNLGFANAVFGLIKLNEKNFAEAQKYLEKAVQTDAQNYLAHYGYAYVLSREGMSDFGFVIAYNVKFAEKIRESLRRAIALNPNFAESYHLYALINIVRNENLDEALETINKALRIAPGNQWYAMRLAEIYMRRQNFAEARNITQKILKTVSDDELKLYAQSTLNMNNAWEAQLEDVKNQQKRPQDEVTDKILSEEEIARLNEIAMNQSLNESLRKPRPGETRILGFLTGVECDSNQIIYSLKSGNQTIVLKSNSLDDVTLTAFASTNTKFGCGTLKTEPYAVITFRTNAETKNKINGVAVAIEFVPKNFRFVAGEKIK
ncbi:MAG TPA: tetratricopeptide repeat protein [Pyrinomonadaceae bacterium]